MSEKWDGNERRRDAREMMELLTSMDKNLALMAQTQKTTSDWMSKHENQDDSRHKELNTRIGGLQRIGVYLLIGLGITGGTQLVKAALAIAGK